MKKQRIKGLSLSLMTVLALNAAAAQQSVKDSQSLGSVDVVSSDTSIHSDSYTVESMKTSTKLELSLKDTPQSVMVFTRQKLDDLGITSYQELLSKTPGVTLNQWDERVYPTARGFGLDYYLFDGIPTYSVNDQADDPDLAIYDRIEVVKGANGLMTGAGNPAIGLNFIRKHATSDELKGDINVSAGSWNDYSTTLDVQSPLNSDGTIRARVVAKHQDRESFMDKYEKTVNVLYGVVDMDLTDTTFLSLGASVEDIERSGIRWGGLPAFYNDGTQTHFDRSATVSDDWTQWNIKTESFYADLKQYIFDDVSINVSASHRNIKGNSNLLYYGGRVNKATGEQFLVAGDYGVYGYKSYSEREEDNLDIYTSIPFEVANLDQEIIVGGMFNKLEQVKSNYANSLNWDSINFNNISMPAPTYGASTDQPLDETTQTGMYLVGKFSLARDLKLISGMRVSSWKYEHEQGTGNREFKNELTPYTGLVYNLNENHSVYASYTSIFKPQDKKDSSGTYLDPIKGKNYETGIKGEYFDGALNASLSVFRIEQDGVAEDTGTVNADLEKIYEAKEGVVSKGFEIGLSGNVTENFSLDFGVANFEAKNADGSKYDTQSSRTTANLFAKYTLNKLRLGAGLNYKSKYYTDTSYGRITQDAYTTADLMAGYRIDKNMDLQLNVNNVFDKEYYAGVGVNSMVYGTPRSATVNLRYSF